jgi:hypothetical protein
MSTVSSGNFTNKDLLDDITSFVTNHYTINKVKTNHLWVNELSDNILSKIDNVRTSNDILDTIQKTFPDSTVKSVPEVDEIYYAVSPKDASGSDRALVDCHFDAPFYWVPGSVRFYRIIIACNENDAVETSFPNDNISVKMDRGDFHGLDYNHDFHCVKGSIPEGKHRVLLKMHYLIVPKLYENSYTESIVKSLNVNWIYISRWIMNKSAKPSTFSEHFTALVVNGSMFVYNNFIFIILILVIVYFLVKRNKKLNL